MGRYKSNRRHLKLIKLTRLQIEGRRILRCSHHIHASHFFSCPDHSTWEVITMYNSPANPVRSRSDLCSIWNRIWEYFQVRIEKENFYKKIRAGWRLVSLPNPFQNFLFGNRDRFGKWFRNSSCCSELPDPIFVPSRIWLY